MHTSGAAWKVHFVVEGHNWPDDPLLERADVGRPRLDAGRPFLLHGSGAAHEAVNAFFASGRMRNLSEGTNRKYAYSLCTWINFLSLRNKGWDSAVEGDLFDFRFWRTTDFSNDRRVAGSTWQGNRAGILAFHDWAVDRLGAARLLPLAERRTSDGRSGTRDRRSSSTSVRSADVKWLTPGAFRLWRDVGVHGISREGLERTRWRPRMQGRDAGFVDGLYSTGLRIQELASLVVPELPPAGDGRGFVTARLADRCAKGGHGRRFWIGRSALDGIWDYVETERAGSVRSAQDKGLYQRVPGMLVVDEVGSDGSVRASRAGVVVRSRLRDLSPKDRLKLFKETDGGLEPLSLWLNEDGLPRGKKAWYTTFRLANARVEKGGIERLKCHPHMLRHSFALRWYAVGRLVWERGSREDRFEDFREQFGDTWSLVQTMLGHRDVATTKSIYLEPFLGLDVQFLLAHHASDPETGTAFDLVRGDPRVRFLGPEES
ncbi:site-specific integrase [Sinomonas terrae]|uniref:Site-specific integrase n=1 Tax=Sinomonas terrae TaxID=2908838 RepID=A0ABS9U6V6_9MICC|nr:site-specific integrase [Sinomonas terrae]MCH6472433.1 site-specific integrase [Sinomonas terrae]